MKIEKNRPEKFFFQILENSPQGIILFDSLMTCCYFNLKASKILKIKNRDIPVGQKLKELAPGIEKTPRYQKYLDTLSTGRSHTVYFNVEVKSQIKYLQVKSLKVDDNLVLYINDISKIVKQESTYFYVKNYLETLLSAINIPVLIKNINNVYELMNDAIVDVLSTDNEMTQLEFDKKVIGNSKEFHSCENQVLLGKKEKANIEISFKKKDGTIHDFSVVIVPLKNEMNIITGLIEVCFDITELNMTDAELKLLAATVSHSTEGILITDATGIILYVNEAYEELTGYKNEELIGKNPSLLKSGVHPDKFYKKLWKKISKGELWEGLFVNKHKDGTLYREKAVIFPIISDKNKRITNFVAIKRDVTHETELEEQLRQAQKMEAVGRLAGGIAHDFNNILTSIQGYNEVLSMITDSSMKTYKPIQEIKKSCKRAVNLTRQLLAFSRKQVFYLKDIELNKTVESMLGMLNRLVGVNTDLNLNLQKEKLVIKSDLSMLEQVILNLVINASDACGDKGNSSITITTGKKFLKEVYLDGNFKVSPGYYALLQVSDNGEGISEEIKQKIFDPFFTTKSEGTGLGLSTVYGIVKQQNGYIQVETTLGKGCIFNVYFPLNQESEFCSDTGFVKTQNILKSGSGIIMVLEDDDSLRELLETILTRAGYDIITAASSAEVYKKLPDRGIDLLLADIILKGERGNDIAKNLKKEHKNMKTLFISGYVGKTISNVDFDIPDCEFMAKPFSISDLTAKIKLMLNSEETSEIRKDS